jgi:RNA polymerase sigma factor (TIGR02999 family)
VNPELRCAAAARRGRRRCGTLGQGREENARVSDLTELVAAADAGDADALKRLFATVYGELKRLARRQLADAVAPTLDTTGLVHEAYLKLVNPERLALRDNRHFFVVAAKAMRQIVIDHARRRAAIKRGGDAAPVTLEADLPVDAMTPDLLIRLDRALDALATFDGRLAELVEMRYFAGLSVDQIADTQNLTSRTVHRDWRRARAFLYDAIRAE